MGWFGDSNEDTKTVDSNGEVNNNVVIQERVDVFSAEITWMLGLLCILKLLEFGSYLYINHKRSMKKKYLGQPARV